MTKYRWRKRLETDQIDTKKANIFYLISDILLNIEAWKFHIEYINQTSDQLGNNKDQKLKITGELSNRNVVGFSHRPEH